MIVSRDFVNYQGQRAQVIKIHPHSNKVDIAVGLTRKTVDYSELTKASNKFTPKKTAEQMKEDFLQEIENVMQRYCSGTNPYAEGGRIALTKLKSKILTGNYDANN
jgi:hypothetical protein